VETRIIKVEEFISALRDIPYADALVDEDDIEPETDEALEAEARAYLDKSVWEFVGWPSAVLSHFGIPADATMVSGNRSLAVFHLDETKGGGRE